MRTILLLGVAAGSLLLAGRANSTEAPAPSPSLEYGVPTATDTRVYTGYPDRVPSEVEYRGGDYPPPPPGAVFRGSYDAEGRWTGTWDGTYEAPDGRRYHGSYEGSVEGRPGAGVDYPPPPPGYAPYYGGYDHAYEEEMQRRCGQGGTVGGAVVGGVVGGIAGNRIAGRGNRTAGTLIGGGLGAIAGAAIGDAADRQRCEAWRVSRGGYYQGGAYQHGYGYGYGYGYYTPGVVVTTIINGPPVVTERVETSTRTYYETVPVKKRVVAKKRWKPKPKPRCVC